MKSQNINWRKGFFRMTFVLSILLGLLGLFTGFILSSGPSLVLFVAVPFGFVWLLYFVVGFIVRGFSDKGGKS